MKQYEKTGALIASVRKEKGLTQKELAVTLHVSDTTVSKWERGIGFPDVSLVEPLAAALGLTIGELFAGERAAEPLPQECEALLSGVLTESNAQSRRKRPGGSHRIRSRARHPDFNCRPAAVLPGKAARRAARNHTSAPGRKKRSLGRKGARAPSLR